ncbi:FecR family protein [Paraflavitalea speifideaquila]|uniref:FecR family protein n=1 Tax=Paraflavitalea speifideaquila TaxID=3076558 RepID=UPI0028F16EA8|nr:FecR family protein [Paraflavitalea speifideiaquila]
MATERIWELMARKLAGEASEEELKELEQLLRTHPDLHFPIQAITDLWQNASQPEGQQDMSVTSRYEQHIARMQQMGIPIGQAPDDKALLLEGSRQPSRRRPLLWAAAAVCILAAASFIYNLYFSSAAKTISQVENNPPSEITTRNGSKTRVQLPDGTRVWLNAGSKLTYNKEFGSTVREVTLIGEGYFDVVRNEKNLLSFTPPKWM